MTDNWETPTWLWDLIHLGFKPNLDPCPINGAGGLDILWTGTVYCNPPYSDILPWVEKAIESDCKTIMLVPVRTATYWWSLVDDLKILYLPRFRFKGAQYNMREACCLIFFGDFA
jgi:hypothetical protein